MEECGRCYPTETKAANRKNKYVNVPLIISSTAPLRIKSDKKRVDWTTTSLWEARECKQGKERRQRNRQNTRHPSRNLTFAQRQVRPSNTITSSIPCHNNRPRTTPQTPEIDNSVNTVRILDSDVVEKKKSEMDVGSLNGVIERHEMFATPGRKDGAGHQPSSSISANRKME